MDKETSMATMAEIRLKPDDGLLVIHVQNDFLPGGRLAVTGGDAVIPVLNDWIARFLAAGLPIIATRDWHPPDHCSFQAQGGPWPEHCVAGSPGAAYSPDLALPTGTQIISQAKRPEAEAYSGFDGTELRDELERRGVRRLFIGGLATDYCVLNTVLDGLRLGYQVVLLTDAIRAVEARPGDGERAIAAMLAAGAVPWGGS
jgi:nicotinamidase/pyrazinamidase